VIRGPLILQVRQEQKARIDGMANKGAISSDLYSFHVNGSIGIVQKIEFEIRPDLGCKTFKTSRKVGFDNPSVCVCLSCCSFSRKLSRA